MRWREEAEKAVLVAPPHLAPVLAFTLLASHSRVTELVPSSDFME